MNIKTKLVTVLTLAVLVVPGISMAQTMSVAQLQAEIQSLTAQLTQLEAQLAAAGGSTTAWCYTFNNNLYVGMSGNEVTELQTALQKDGESVTVNGTFDDQTAAAVTAFQEKYQSTILTPYGLSNGTGYAGKGTRAEINSLFGCSGSNPVTPPIVVNPIAPTPTPTRPVACPMYVPYCPYGGHSVVGSNGCSQTVCNQAPAQQSVTINSPTANQTLASGSTLNIQWTPASTGVAMIVLQPTSGGSWYQLYGEKVDGDPVNYNGSYSANLTGVPAGSYSLKLFADNQGNTLLGQVSSLTISAAPIINGINPTQGTATTNVTISGYNLTSGGNPLIQFYGSNGTLAGTIYFINMNNISAQGITFNPSATNVALAPGTYQVDVVTPNGTSNQMSFTVNAAPVPAPVINSFSVGAGPTFSLAAYNYNTITFQAQCGSFVDVLRSPDGTSVSYPTGSASICNAPQTYSSSSFNETPNMAPQMVNVPLALYNAQGVVDGSITYVGSPAGSNNSGRAMLTVNVCNTANVCVQQTASFQIYAKACLAAGTKISMADGSYKDIEDIKIGDVVKSSNGKIVTDETVTNVVQREDPIITINRALGAAPDEVVYLANGKTETANLIKVGDQLLGQNGQVVTVTTIVRSNQLTKTYDLVLGNGNSFFADGYLVQALSASE